MSTTIQELRLAISKTTRTHSGVRQSVFIIHVGGTRDVTSSTDNSIKIQARITLTVECLRTCIFFYFHLMFEYNYEYDQLLTFFNRTTPTHRCWKRKA
jgi:hypothetical protein